MSYRLSDVRESALGTFIAILFFYLLKAGEPILINPKNGFIIGIIWIIITGIPLLSRSKDSKTHMIMNVLVALVISSVLTVMFEMATWEQLKSFQFFGTSAWLGMLLGISSAQFFDKMNISNPYDVWYHKKRR